MDQASRETKTQPSLNPGPTEKAAIYVREASADSDLPTVADQIAICRREASARGFDVARTYIDIDLSGLTFEGRPGFDKLLKAAARKLFDAVIVAGAGCICRDQALSAVAHGALYERDVAVISASEGVLDINGSIQRLFAIFHQQTYRKALRHLRRRSKSLRVSGGG